MNAGSKLAGFGLVLVGALGLGALAGNVVGPISASEDRGGDRMTMDDGGHGGSLDDGATEPADAATTETVTVDGYEVLLTGTPTAGAVSELGLTVRRDGRPVTDLDPYPGAFGHLVAIRGDDLSDLLVHPVGDAPADAGDRGGPEVAFAVEIPAPGEYRLIFDFAHDGTVHTAAFTVHVPAPDAPSGAEPHTEGHA